MAQPGGETRAALEREFPGVAVLERGEQVRAVFGRPMTRAATARAAIEDWMDLYQAVFGVDELEWVERYGAEISGGRVAFSLRQEVTVEGGILTEPTALRVEGGKLRALVGPDGEDFAVTYVAARVVDTDGGVAAPQITGAEAIAAAGRNERTRHLKEWGEPELVVVEMDLGAGPEVFAAWRLAGQESEIASLSTLIVHVDAVTGAVVRVQPGVVHGNPVTGTVTGGATSGLGPPLPASTAEEPLPALVVEVIGGDSTTTDEAGEYGLDAAGSSVDVNASLDGGYWFIVDEVGGGSATSQIVKGVTPPASGVDFPFNPVALPGTPDTQEDTAPVNAYLNVQISNAFFDERIDNWQSILENELLTLKVVVNESGACGANFSQPGGTELLPRLQFRKATSGCNNAAYSTWITHEYGHYIAHYLVEAVSQSDAGFHEGYADSLAMLVYNTDTFGLDFDPNYPYVRRPGTATVDYPACAQIGGGGQGPDRHYNGQLLGRIWWDIRTNGTSTDPLATARLLFTDWTMLSAGSADPHASCLSWRQPADVETLIEVLTVDDDDDDLSNGTPNGAIICQAFADREIESPPGLGLCPLPLHGGPACRVDVNYDGLLDFFDFVEFELMFSLGDMFCDFNADGELDLFDLLEFQTEFAAGCW